ncbi:MAG TPA: hypothetical protein PKL78_07615 [Anaerolineales bacterium]|nr:hypothetical protein [Anaerolineales bacterium]
MLNHIVNLERLPKTNNQYIWADYVELLTLYNSDRQVSKSDLLSRLQERADLGETEDLDSDLDDQSQKDDRWSLLLGDCFLNLEYRNSEFGEAYPFVVSEKPVMLKCKDNLTFQHKLYIFFLLASSLWAVSKKSQSQITSFFEIVSLEAIKSYMPSHSKSFLFGKNPLNDGLFTGKLFEKIQKLADELNETTNIREEDFETGNTGDKGLDIVSYIPFNDKESGMILAFAQCACTTDWVSKQHDSSEDAWSNIISITGRLSNMVFIPFCFRDATGGWYHRVDIKKSILVDRPRLVYLLQKRLDILSGLAIPVVDEFLSEQETTF